MRRESNEVEASWEKFNTAIENLAQTRVDYIIDVLGIEGLNTGLKSIEKATLAPLQVYQHVKNVGRKYSNCDAVLITSAAWPTLTVIQALEDDIGKPVISSAVGQIWAPLHELGIRARINDYGTLLRTLSGETS